MTNTNNAQDFPDFDNTNNESDKVKGKRPFINQLFQTDSLTVANGFINGIRSHVKGDRTLYFVSVGLLQGSVQDGDNYKGDITNCDVLAGSTLDKWLSGLVDIDNPLKGIRVSMEIRNLKFLPKLHDGKAYVDTRGILETVKFGYISK